MVKKQKKKSINYFKRIFFSIAGKRYNEMIDVSCIMIHNFIAKEGRSK